MCKTKPALHQASCCAFPGYFMQVIPGDSDPQKPNAQHEQHSMLPMYHAQCTGKTLHLGPGAPHCKAQCDAVGKLSVYHEGLTTCVHSFQ